MMGASEDLLQAVYGLRRAAETDFQGNAYYQVANRIDGLIEHLGWGHGRIAVGKDAAYGFASMLAEVRKIAEASTSGDRYRMIALELDHLASLLQPAAPKATAVSEKRRAAIAANAPVATPAAAPAFMYGARPTFDTLAAISKARVEEVSASLGIAAAHHSTALHRKAEPMLGDGELERRSSEPCAMAELAPVILEPVAAAALSAEALAVPRLEGAAQHLGSPSAQAGDGAIQGTAAASSPQTPAQPAAKPAASAHDRAADAARQAPGERRLESRSSEAVTQPLASVEPAAIPGEIAAEPNAAEAAFYLGSPAPESKPGDVEETVTGGIAAAEIAAQRAAAGASGEQPKPKQKKTFFRLWLAFAFGRKN